MPASPLTEYLADSPVLMWALDENTGTVFRDLNANANHANVSGGPTLNQVGPGSLRAAHFNGSSASANRDPSIGPINGPSFPFGSGARSQECWAYPMYAPGVNGGCLVSYGKVGANLTHSILQLGGGGQAGSAFTDGVNGGNNRSWTTDFTQNKWQHFVMTYAGGTNGAFIFYRDGVVDLSSTVTLNTTVSPDYLRCALRTDYPTAAAWFTGRISMAAVYATALSPTRIQAHYDAVRQTGVSY